MMPPLPTFIDLFSGCGGFTLGMLRVNLVDRHHEGFAAPKHALQRDLTQFSPKELATLIGADRLDVIVGGPPCQGFSTARQRDGSNHGIERLKEDSRRHLYRHFLDYVEFFQPRVFVIENVLGLRTAAGGRYFTAVQHEARVLGKERGLPGYRVHSQIEDASGLGVPQKRRRQLIIGVRNDLPGYFPPNLSPVKRATIGVTLGDAICDLPPLNAGEGTHTWDYDFERRKGFLCGRRRPIRQRYLFQVLEVQHAGRLLNHVARPHSARDLRDFALLPEGATSAELMRQGVSFEFPYDKSSFKDRYTRQHRYRTCSTIVAHLSKDGLMFIHPTQNRSFTPREAARVQSFPDWYAFPEARTHAFRLIGNAVPPLIAESVGSAIAGFLSDAYANSAPARSAREPSANDAHSSASRCPQTSPSSVPKSQALALGALEKLLHLDRRRLKQLSREEFLLGWHALLFLFPGLHPDSALDHGDDVEIAGVCQLALPGFENVLARRYARSGWPVALELIGREAWRRYEAKEVFDHDFYSVAAQRAGIRIARCDTVPV